MPKFIFDNGSNTIFEFTFNNSNYQTNYAESSVQYMNRKQKEKELQNITDMEEISGVWQIKF